MGPKPQSSMMPPSASRGVLLGLLISFLLPAVARAVPPDGTWSLVPGSSLLIERARHAMIYDVVNQQVIVFGGLQHSELENDVWALPLGSAPVWAQLSPQGTPPTPRSDMAAIYDPVRRRMVVFGGTDGALQNEVWTLSLDTPRTWTRLEPTGTPPTPRRSAVAVYHPTLDRMIVVGGYDGSAARNDAWALSLGADPGWTQLAPTGTPPGGREGACADYDPNQNRLVLFGGYNAITNKYIGDTWSLTLSASPAWRRLFSGAEPGPRAWSSAIHDPVSNWMVLVGGLDAQRSYSDTYVMQLYTSSWAAWGPGPAHMARRHAHGAVYDSQRRRVVLFGGGVDPAQFPLGDVWALGLQSPTAWTKISPTNQPPFPAPRREFSAVLANDDFVVFGGEATGSFPNDAYVLPMSGSGSWAPLEDSGVRPPGRTDSRAIYDPLRNRFLILGGYNGARLTDVWEYSFITRAWGQLVASSNSLLSLAGAIYDPVRQRAILLDAGSSAALYTMEMRLDDYAFSVIPNPQPSTSIPDARVAFSVIYQPSQDRIVVFGGFDYWGGGALDEVWFLPLSGPAIWTHPTVQGVSPSARWGHSAVYDETRDRMVVIGGYDGSTGLNDVWALTLGPTPTWAQLNPLGTPPQPRDAAGALYDATRQRVVLFGGFDPGAPAFLNDLGFLAFGGTVSVEPPQPARLSLAGARPNPAAQAFSIRFSLEDASPARLELFDVAGRLMFTRDVGSLGAGQHELRIADAITMPDGLYFVRLRQHARALTSRVLVAH